jgi:hypothetical protein
VDVLRVVLPADVPRLAEARVDGVAAAFALGAGIVVTLLAGLTPALRGARVDLQSVLRIAASGGASHERLRRAFVVAQVAVAVVLACAGVLLTRSASALDAAPRGYESAGVVTASLTLPAATYRDAPAIAAVIDRIVGGATAVPGVQAAAAASQLPFAGGSAGSDVVLAGEPMTPGVNRQARVRLVSAAYLSTLGVAMMDGREIGREDSTTSRPVVVVNQTLARRLSPGSSPVGRDVTFGVPVFNGDDGTRVWHVGVAADTWDRGPREAVEPEVFLPIAQTPAEVFFWISRELQLAVRVQGPSADGDRAGAPAGGDRGGPGAADGRRSHARRPRGAVVRARAPDGAAAGRARRRRRAAGAARARRHHPSAGAAAPPRHRHSPGHRRTRARRRARTGADGARLAVT